MGEHFIELQGAISLCRTLSVEKLRKNFVYFFSLITFVLFTFLLITT